MTLGRGRLVGLVSLVLAAGCTPISYVYDPSGRLRGAIEPGAETATYSYDDAGNVVAVDRYGSDAVSVVGFAPVRGPVGYEVVVQGTGFGAEPADNTVTFDGTAAEVTAASETELRVTVPDGATTGALEVTSPSGTASSSEPFTVEPDRTPVVSALSPSVAAPGNTVTVEGANFADDPLLDAVVVGGRMYATVAAASSSELAVRVPQGATSGRVSVATPDGTGEGSADLFVAPPGYTAADVDSTARVEVGETATVAVDTARHVGLMVFDGEAGQRVSVALTDSGFPTCQPVVSLLGPDGDELGTGTCQPLANGFVEPVMLPETGTYTVVVASTTATASAGVTVHEVPADVTEAVTLDGTEATVATDVPGQNAELSFAGTAGQRVSLQITADSYSSCSPRVRVFAPHGTELVTHACVTTGVAGFTEPFELPDTGTYRVRVDPIGPATGEITFAVHDVPADVTGPITVGGDPVTVDIAVPGRNAELSFDGTAGQRVSIGINDRDFSVCNPPIRLLAPDGTEVVANTCPGPTTDLLGPASLPANGTYRIAVDPSGAATGSVTLALHDVPPDVTGTLTVDGDPVTVALGVPGQKAELTFDATAGDDRTLGLSGDTFAICSPEVRVFQPDDTELASNTCVLSSASIALADLPATGTYRVTVHPTGTTTGQVTLALTGGAPVAAAEPPTAGAGDEDGDDDEDGDGSGDGAVERGAALREAPATVAVDSSTSVAAISGRVRRTDGAALAGATLSADGQETTTSSTGSFTLELPGTQTGMHELTVDGRSANQGDTEYGTFVFGVEVSAGETTELDQTIWMPELDTAHAVTLDYPLTDDVVVTNPNIPDLEVYIPAGSEITDANGDLVTEVGITPIPPDRPPFPLPAGADPPVHFTIQPGGASIGPEGVRIVYPNEDDEPPGAWVSLLDYAPIDGGWHAYGRGEVSADGSQIVPDPGVAIQRFTATLTEATGYVAPPDGPSVGNGDYPVDLATGLFVQETTDLAVDDLLPVSVSRTYRPDDPTSRAFGVGSALSFDLSLWTSWPYEQAQLVLPDGVRLTYERTSGTGYSNAVFEHTATPTGFYGSRITWNGEAFELALKDGTTFVFGFNASLQAIRDRQGNEITLQHAQRNLSGAGVGNVTAIYTPTGRWVELAYDDQDRVVEARDHLGRTVGYAYDAEGRLATVTNPAGGDTAYGYDAAGRLQTITDPRDVTALTIDYDAEGRVTQQTGADGSSFSFDYTTDSDGDVTRTEVTDPRGAVRRVDFTDGYWVTDTAAVGTAQEQTLTVERQAGSRLITASVDQAGRRTAYTYDSSGNRISVTRPAGTPDAVTTTYAYEPDFHQVETVTDPLDRTTSYGYDDYGNLTTVTDPTGAETTYAYDDQGRLVSATDSLGNTTETAHELLHRVTVTDPLGQQASQFLDAAGRPAVVTDPLGNRTRLAYDAVDQLTSATDPTGAETTLGYDPAGNLTSVTDANGNETSYTYDDMGRAETRTDPLGATDSLDYDAAGNVTERTDRRDVVTTFDYDELGRITSASFGVTGDGAESTIDYAYDTAGRLTEADDSAYGAVELGYDGLDRLTAETSPEGQVTYGYDAAGQRTSMSIAGGPATSYGYDAAGLLTSITQGPVAATATRDPLGRATELTLPNGVTAAYDYDAVSNLTSIEYTAAGAADPLGDLTYTYDPLGRRISVSGSLADTTAPEPVTSADHDAGNRLTSRDGTAYTYDDAGNLTSDGANTYTWDARGQLSEIDGPVTADFDYDPFGRRTGKTVDGTTTSYLYDGANITQQQPGTPGATTYLTGLAVDEVLARSDATGTTTTYLPDGLGSTIGLVDATGAIATSYTYDPHGVTTVEGSPDPNPFAFTGRELDETGLYYYRARYYQPETGRFISQDPIGFSGGDTNLYAYAANDPVNRVDPTGLCGIDLTVDIFATLDRVNWWSLGPDGFLAQVAADPSAVDRLITEVTGLAAAHCAAAVGGGVGGIGGSLGGGLGRRVPPAGAIGELAPPSTINNAASPIRSFVTAEDRAYYRVFSGSRTRGGFLVGSPPASAADAVRDLALPPGNRAEFIQEVLVPRGTRLQSSTAAGAFGQPGGALQFELLEQIPDSNFGPGVPFP